MINNSTQFIAQTHTYLLPNLMHKGKKGVDGTETDTPPKQTHQFLASYKLLAGMISFVSCLSKNTVTRLIEELLLGNVSKET